MNMSEQQKCRICGCTQDRACDPPCEWVERDLCSGCVIEALSRDADFCRLMLHPVSIETDGQTAVQLVSVIQLACRHRQFDGPVKESMAGLARQIQAALSEVGTPALAWMLEVGWDRARDVPVEKPRIILPGE
jgi:hypothetical protein